MRREAVEANYRAFRQGESEFYDLYWRFLDEPATFGKTEEVQLRRYFSETEAIRRYVRAAEIGNLPSLDDSRDRASVDGAADRDDGSSK
jgi:hypothetical protein